MELCWKWFTFWTIWLKKKSCFQQSLPLLFIFLSTCLRWAKWISVHCILSSSSLLMQLLTVHFIVKNMTNICQSWSCIFSVWRTVCAMWCLGLEINFLWCLFWYMLWIAVCTLAWNRFKWSWVLPLSLTNLCCAEELYLSVQYYHSPWEVELSTLDFSSEEENSVTCFAQDNWTTWCWEVKEEFQQGQLSMAAKG